eukprot:1154237-Pelagomonas_calceolata.AAC.1
MTVHGEWQAGKHKLRNVACFRLHAHTLKIETPLWQEHTSECEKCDQGGLQDEKHAVFLCSCDPMISDLMDISCLAGTVEQTEQPNYLAEVGTVEQAKQPNYWLKVFASWLWQAHTEENGVLPFTCTHYKRYDFTLAGAYI